MGGTRMSANIQTTVQLKQAPGRARVAAPPRPDNLTDPLEEVQRSAEQGTRGPGGSMPHLDRIQAAFGAYDLSGVRAHTGAEARAGCEDMGAEAFATGSSLAFRGTPSLFVAAHEAAHVVQQQGGVQLKGGVGRHGDAYERHADAVAGAVVRGESAEPLLEQMAGSAGGGVGGGSVGGGSVGPEAPVQMFTLNPFKAIKNAWNKRKQRKNQKKMDEKAQELRDDRDRWLTNERQGLNIRDAYEEGDLFYGLARPREKVMQNAVDDFDEHLNTYDDNGIVAPKKAPMFLDTINNMFLGTGSEVSDNNLFQKHGGSKEERNQWIKEMNTYQGEKENEIPEVKGFREYMEGHEKYDPKMAPGQEQWNTRVGRACKAGLEYTTVELNKKIHFVLDDYDFSYLWDDINKKGEDRAITSKELKWLFRNWDNPSVASNVIFWRGGQVVLPPWVADPTPWQNYKLYRANKAKNKN